MPLAFRASVFFGGSSSPMIVHDVRRPMAKCCAREESPWLRTKYHSQVLRPRGALTQVEKRASLVRLRKTRARSVPHDADTTTPYQSCIEFLGCWLPPSTFTGTNCKRGKLRGVMERASCVDDIEYSVQDAGSPFGDEIHAWGCSGGSVFLPHKFLVEVEEAKCFEGDTERGIRQRASATSAALATVSVHANPRPCRKPVLKRSFLWKQTLPKNL